MKVTDKKIAANKENAKLAGLANKREKVEFICLNCKEKSFIHLCLLKRGKKYCSWDCRIKHMKGDNASNANGGEWMRGESNPRWKGGIENKEIRNDKKEHSSWRRRVFARDKHTCQKCKLFPKLKGQLNAHHLIPWSVNFYLRYNINNGLTLCISCHKEVHKNGWENFINPEYVEQMMGYPINWTKIE